MYKFEIYKPGQGKWTRLGTFCGIMLVVVIGAVLLPEKVGSWVSQSVYIRFGLPSALTLVLAGVMFWVVNRPSNADFMIATESEMKKVSWSSRKEVIGSTKVVIVTTMIMACILYGADVLFVWVFNVLHLMGQ